MEVNDQRDRLKRVGERGRKGTMSPNKCAVEADRSHLQTEHYHNS